MSDPIDALNQANSGKESSDSNQIPKKNGSSSEEQASEQVKPPAEAHLSNLGPTSQATGEVDSGPRQLQDATDSKERSIWRRLMYPASDRCVILQFRCAIPWLLLLFLLIFVAANVGIFELLTEGKTRLQTRTWALVGVLVMTALWFIDCFSGDAEKRKTECFVFAYAFTFGAFALLITPFITSDMDAPTTGATGSALRPEGVLQLVRGCIKSDLGSSNTFDGMRCRNDWGVLPNVVAAPAGGASAATTKLTGEDLGRDYGWLLSIGGVMVQHIQLTSTNAQVKNSGRYVEVYGGLAVPMFVIVLSFIGGAVSLSRRIPEYQRRSEPLYDPNEKEPAMKAFQAREAVVFQIMQLISAPFLAVATWYIVSPANLSSAAVLAFGTGFASEPLLLMVRGMVEGIRPDSTRTQSPRSSNVRGLVFTKDAAGTRIVVPGATVKLLSVAGPDTRLTVTGAKGQFIYENVPLGSYTLEAALSPKQSGPGRPINVSEKPMGDVEIDIS